MPVYAYKIEQWYYVHCSSDIVQYCSDIVLHFLVPVASNYKNQFK